jgi:hypothetical protein
MNMNTLSHHPMQATRPGMDRFDTRMCKAAAIRCGDDEIDAQDVLQHYLAAQAAINARNLKKAQRMEWAAAAVGIVWLTLSLAALVANAAYFWP